MLTAKDDVCPAPVIYYRINGGATITRTVTAIFAITNSDAVEYWTVDSSFNVSAHKKIASLAGPDKTPPTVAAAITRLPNGRQVRVAASDSRSTPTVYYRINSGATKTVLRTAVFIITDTQSAEYWAKDGAGNASAHKKIAALIAPDRTPPTVSATVTPVADGREVHITASDNESTPTVRYRVNGGAVVSTGAPTAQVVIGIPDTLEYWAVDRAGNSSAHKKIASAAPSIKLTATPSTVTYPQIVTLTAIAANPETTTAVFEVRLEGDPADKWTTLATPTSATGRFVIFHVPTKRAYYRVTLGLVTATAQAYVEAGMSRPNASTTRVKVGRLVTFSGTIRPQHPVGFLSDGVYKVYFWKYNARMKKWVETGTVQSWPIAGLVDNATSRWSYQRKFTASQVGTWRVRFYHRCPRHKGAFSPALTFSVVR